MPFNNLLTSLSALPVSAPRDAYLSLLNSAGDAALRRHGGPEHVTGSCFVFSPAFDQVLLSPAIVDLDRHDLDSGFSCAAHWDVGFAAVAAPDVEISVSDESEDVRWFPINDLPARVPAGFSARLERVQRTAVRMSLQ